MMKISITVELTHKMKRFSFQIFHFPHICSSYFPVTRISLWYSLNSPFERGNNVKMRRRIKEISYIALRSCRIVVVHCLLRGRFERFNNGWKMWNDICYETTTDDNRMRYRIMCTHSRSHTSHGDGMQTPNFVKQMQHENGWMKKRPSRSIKSNFTRYFPNETRVEVEWWKVENTTNIQDDCIKWTRRIMDKVAENIHWTLSVVKLTRALIRKAAKTKSNKTLKNVTNGNFPFNISWNEIMSAQLGERRNSELTTFSCE